MRKSLVIFIGMFLCGLVAMCVLPFVILKEADQVTVTEQVLSGDKTLVEGVTVQTVNHSMEHLFWNTEYVAGKAPETKTKYEFFAERKSNNVSMTLEESWLSEDEQECLGLMNSMKGGWTSSSNGNIDLEKNRLIVGCGLVEAYKELAEETGPGEEKTKQIVLNQYMEYFPIMVSLGIMREDESLSEAYSDFFRIPVPESAMYTISLQKNNQGDITRVEGGKLEKENFKWKSTSTRTEEACYFTFSCYYGEGLSVETDLIPGGYGIYKQPYTVEDGEIIMDASELSMVYSLEDAYPNGNIFLDVNGAGQLLILMDTETTTRLQVVDLETMECVQQTEVLRPEQSSSFDSVIRVKEDFLLLSYGDGYFALVDRNTERGYEHQFTIQVPEDDPIYWSGFVEYKDMDWNGKQLLYASCTNGDTLESSCDFTLAAYDATGKVYEGRYCNSLWTDQERKFPYQINTACGPWGDTPIAVSWPE